jgi:hypothetical protein
MERDRKSLPAAKARGDFLSVMKQADEVRQFINKKRNGCNRYQGARKSSPWVDSEKSDDVEDADTQSEMDDFRTSSRSDNIPIEELVARVDECHIDNDMIGHLVKHLVMEKEAKDDGSILVFLPGAPEINKAMDSIRKIIGGLPIQLLPLHGGLQPKQQNLVFQPASRGYTKVTLSTNVAETSITIPDCTIVIDSCREKQSSYDPSNRMPLLVEKFTAKANAKQRRGRAGRVRSGTCYKLLSKKTYDSLPDHGEPEIRRCTLVRCSCRSCLLVWSAEPAIFCKHCSIHLSRNQRMPQSSVCKDLVR